MSVITRRQGTLVGALSLLFLASCADSDVVAPALESFPSFAIVDGSTTGSPDFYFLPPLANGNPNPVGTFNDNLLPAVRICELDELAGSCVSGPPAAYFGPGAATAAADHYQLNWDTNGPETSRINANKFYRLEVLVADEVMGWIELDPRRSNQTQGNQPNVDAYPFEVGETIPVKFWLSTQVLCDGAGYVTECITGAVIDETGGVLRLENAGNRLGLTVFEEALPGENHPPITVTIERIDPALFLAQTGAECIPMFDAPQFADCFRVNTLPELGAPLDIPALVSICMDPLQLSGINLPESQQNQLTMVRYNDGVWEGLPDTQGDCPVNTADLLPLPDVPFLKNAVAGLNAVARFLGPQPLAARDIRFGGFTSSFSRFRYALPGVMVPTAGDGAVIQPTDSDTIQAAITVLDHDGVAVENARVRFASGDGTVSQTVVRTGPSGVAAVTWVVDTSTPGAKVLTASALGLFEGNVPEHATAYVFTTEDVDITATVVGPPAQIAQSPTGTIAGTAGESAGNLTITVTDAAGNPVGGAGVSWNGDGSVAGGTTTDAMGTAIGEWTLPTTAGPASMTADVAGITATFDAEAGAGPAVTPTYSDPGSTAVVGTTLPGVLTVTVADQYGNPRSGDAVSWSVTGGGGSVSSAASSTGSDGSATVDWTVGPMVGTNTVLVEVAGFEHTFSIEGVPGAPIQPTGDGGGQTGVVPQALGDQLMVTVTDQFGNPIAGQTVTWSGDGTFMPPTSDTDASGTAATTWTLGPVAGVQNATADVAGYSVGFTATAEPGPVASVTPSGGGASVPIGSSIPVSIVVADAFGNTRVGDAVSWSVTSGGGSISGDAATGTGGAAAGTWTLGPIPGANAATATVDGVTATFSATGVCLDGYGTASIDGAFGAGEWACAQSMPFMANISGGETPAEVYWMNDGTTLYLGVRVVQDAMANKFNSVRFDFDNDGDGIAEAGDDVIGYDFDEGLFLDEHLTQQCANKSQSGCGDADASIDGAGAVGNDGMYTTWELAHPLDSGDGDDFSLTTDDVVGFFLTLRIGNGAQGNTQVPDFRSYTNIRIVGF